MSKRKGLSLEDKRDKMLEIFHETSDVFVLKDIEKLSVKKGIVLQSVKDVLQSLVDDDLVKQEKIGASNYFWSFPAEASVKIETQLVKLEADIAQTKKHKADLTAALQTEKSKKQGSEQRSVALKKLEQLKQEVEGCQKELAKYKGNDPELYQAMRKAADLAKDSANRWLDNLHNLHSWCKKQFAGHDGELNNFFQENGYTDSLDYV
mmetsp:Transcript_594/g.1351  ORF Transcript_594/g.1351 Transcript_594/m.1351 type:complete len:207 (-) Transcript_594:457-1077(-)|eukprot:CAMPEP_0202903134 /NCGR_PEP_ID=MMETSP1392-20130828/22024_1 /ASSEMBLY_ACC=CAM_ASM_000868 /TAXON_ID=225041 /ORGANISM="Chlamydomonas chlamydogama, Strain SAG 11-48b" /LENGTH=206 /DNA_ID=CAMNT_0049590139 /DNA_START=38 /DNA_END=658 /DNA_ORIENTATION=+